MYEQTISHALGLHMHQPPGNLKLLIEENPWEAEQIIRCYERAARYADKYKDVAHLHVGFSGILLEQFLDPQIVDAYRHIIDIPAMLESYRNTPNVELIGMGYYHPIFPLIPQQDWEDHLLQGREIMQQAFGRTPKGFWPPEMAFTMEMIPALIKAGYEYVVVDSVHVQPGDGTQDIYQPYKACHDGKCITIIPRDRDLSNAQESGLNPGWFANEVQQKIWQSPRPHDPRLVTTWSDGENGGWFRQTDESSGFFGYFFAPYMEHARHGEYPSRTVSLSAYLQEHEAQQTAHVQTGAWNVGDTSGYDFAQWAGSDSQRKAVEKVVQVSQRYHQLAQQKSQETAVTKLLEEARHVLLEGQTSCYLFWGDSWIPHLYEHTAQVETLLDHAEKALAAKAQKTATPSNSAQAVSRASQPASSAPETEPAANCGRINGKKSSSRKKVVTKKPSIRKKR
ncbi:MAG: glycoside hydrolase family 57 [Pseudomonadota bacterium]